MKIRSFFTYIWEDTKPKNLKIFSCVTFGILGEMWNHQRKVLKQIRNNSKFGISVEKIDYIEFFRFFWFRRF